MNADPGPLTNHCNRTAANGMTFEVRFQVMCFKKLLMFFSIDSSDLSSIRLEKFPHNLMAKTSRVARYEDILTFQSL